MPLRLLDNVRELNLCFGSSGLMCVIYYSPRVWKNPPFMPLSPALDINEQVRRRRDRIMVGVVVTLLAILTAIEVYLLRVSTALPFVNSIFFFGLMNLNIVLIMVLLFLVFRNGVKLILDERAGLFGSRLRTRLVFSFLLFSIVPTILLFTISALYIKSSFDKWFSIKISSTLERSIEVVQTYYESSKSSATHFATKIAADLGATPPSKNLQEKLEKYRADFGLDGVEYYSDPFSPRTLAIQMEKRDRVPPASLESLHAVFSGKDQCRVQHVGNGELVRCGVRLSARGGVIFVDHFIPLSLASNLSTIHLSYKDFQSSNPLNYPIKSTYFAILSMVTLLILFCALWTGFYVAKRLTGPLEDLVRGTEAVASGNLEYRITPAGGAELSKLMHSFNDMTADLSRHKRDIEATTQDLRQMNEELSHRRRYIEVLLESVQSGVISLDDSGRISMVNAAAARLLRTTTGELVGKSYLTVIPKEHRTEFRELMASLYDTAKPVRREIRIQHPRNERLALLVTLSVLRDERKKRLGVVAVLDDVTDIQKMERMFAWREVAKRIAHEIKNPLTPIQLSVERLRRRYLDKIQDDGTFNQATGIILTEVDSLKNLVSEFSNFARLPEIQTEPEELNEIVTEAIVLYRAAHERILFQIELDDSIGRLQLDRSGMKRALINLFDNAVSAMSGKGELHVKTFFDRTAGFIRVEVADQGCGIPESAYAQLFEPYFSMKAGGTGLGLAIVQRIIADHGGFVRAHANEPQGTKFVIELPERLRVFSEKVGLGLRPLAKTTAAAPEPETFI